MSSTPSDPVPTLSDSQDAVSVLLSVPAKRRDGKLLTMDELSQIEALLRSFASSPNQRAAPSKQQLHDATSALLHTSAGPLSRKWNKTQLATVLHRWVAEAMLLDPFGNQPALFLEVRTSKKGSKMPDHDVYVEQDDGSVATFAILSPAKSEKPPRHPKSATTPELSDTPAKPSVRSPSNSEIGALATPSSCATSASSFMRQLDRLAVESLAATDGGGSVTPGADKFPTPSKPGGPCLGRARKSLPCLLVPHYLHALFLNSCLIPRFRPA